jgi:hypothetical protein
MRSVSNADAGDGTGFSVKGNQGIVFLALPQVVKFSPELREGHLLAAYKKLRRGGQPHVEKFAVVA